MTDRTRHVLVVGCPAEVAARLVPMLERADLDVHTVEASSAVPFLLLTTPFDLILAAYPADGMEIEELLAAARSPEAAAQRAGILLLAEPHRLDEAQSWVDRGANRAVAADWSDAHVWRAVADLLDIAPRVEVRGLVELEATRGRELCHSTNVSATGMQVEGAEMFPPGTQLTFVFALPDRPPPIRGRVEVVRRTDPAREGVRGMGARFVALAGDGTERLDRFIRQRLERRRDPV